MFSSCWIDEHILDAKFFVSTRDATEIKTFSFLIWCLPEYYGERPGWLATYTTIKYYVFP